MLIGSMAGTLSTFTPEERAARVAAGLPDHRSALEAASSCAAERIAEGAQVAAQIRAWREAGR